MKNICTITNDNINKLPKDINLKIGDDMCKKGVNPYTFKQDEFYDIPTNTKSSILVFSLILLYGLFTIIYTFNNENWIITDNIHIRSIFTIIGVEILCLIKFIYLIKEYKENKRIYVYVILPISVVYATIVLGVYIMIYYAMSLSVQTFIGVSYVIFSIFYIISFFYNSKKGMLLSAFFLLLISAIMSIYLLTFFPFIAYTVETDMGTFFVLVLISISIYFIDFIMEDKVSSTITPDIKKWDILNPAK